MFVRLAKSSANFAEKLSAWSAWLTFMVAVFAGVVAYGQLQSSNSSSAKGLYKDYLNLAISKSKFSAMSCDDGSDMEMLKRQRFEYEEYENFVAFLLFSGEEILALKDGWNKWDDVLIGQFSYHALYLRSDDFKGVRSFYSSGVLKLVDEAIAEFDARKCGRED